MGNVEGKMNSNYRPLCFLRRSGILHYFKDKQRLMLVAGLSDRT